MIPKEQTIPRTIYLVRAAEVAVRTLGDASLREAGVTLAQYTVLSVARARAGSTSADLARRLQMTPQSMNEAVLKLEQAGWIDRPRAAGNRRERVIVLTVEGERLLARCDTIISAVETTLFADLTPAALERFRSSLMSVAGVGRATDR